MANRVTVWWQGEEYDAVRQGGPEVGAGPGSVWQLLHEGAPVTSSQPSQPIAQAR